MANGGDYRPILVASILVALLLPAEVRAGDSGPGAAATGRVAVSLLKPPRVESAATIDLAPRRLGGSLVWQVRHCVDGGAPGGRLHLGGEPTRANLLSARTIGSCGVNGRAYLLSVNGRPAGQRSALVALIRPE